MIMIMIRYSSGGNKNIGVDRDNVGSLHVWLVQVPTSLES